VTFGSLKKFSQLALAAVMALEALAPATAVHAQNFTNFFVLGGSYSDAGTYLVPDATGDYVLGGTRFAQRRWTINPAPVWNQHVGTNYGFEITSNLLVDTTSPVANPTTVNNGGTNYA
jgi:phospholipase/lecithinase/hemolysin